MNQVEIAKKILEQGNCRGINCNGDGCEFLMKYSNNCRMQLGNTSDIDLDKVKQWLKEKEMIDLTVNQIVNPPIKCWVSYSTKDEWEERWLMAIVDGEFRCRQAARHDETTEDYTGTISWEQCTLTDPTKKIKKWLTVEDVPVELWCNALFKADEEPTYCAEVMSPNKCTDCDGKLFTDLVYLPLGQPLTGEWLPFENEE